MVVGSCRLVVDIQRRKIGRIRFWRSQGEECRWSAHHIHLSTLIPPIDRGLIMNWEIDEDILILCLYFQVERNAVGKNHPSVKELSRFLRRKRTSIAARTGNVAAIDPENPREGLSNSASQTQRMWHEFCNNPARLNDKCKQIRQEKKEVFEQREKVH